jgi:hypothetical protein
MTESYHGLAWSLGRCRGGRGKVGRPNEDEVGVTCPTAFAVGGDNACPAILTTVDEDAIAFVKLEADSFVFVGTVVDGNARLGGDGDGLRV